MSSGSIGPYNIGNYSNSRVWSGTNNPKPPYGEHPYTLSLRQISGSPSRTYARNGAGVWSYYYSYRSDCNPEIAGTLLDATGADFSSQSKASSAIRTWNGAVFAAQLPQALGQVMSAARGVLGAYHAVRRGQLGQAVRSLARAGAGNGSKRQQQIALRKALSANDVASQWLAFQYGWLPLMGDIKDGMDAVSGMVANAEAVVRVSSTAKDLYKPANQRLTASRVARVSRKMLFKSSPSQKFSLGLMDPLSVAWELLPFSFVVDWFLPIGNYLEAAATLPFLDCTTVKGVLRKSSLTYNEIAFTQKGAWGIEYVDQGGCRAMCVSHVRTVSKAGGPIVKPQMKALNKAFSTGHLQNAAALLTGLISGKRS